MRNIIPKEVIARELAPLPSNEASPDFILMTESANIHPVNRKARFYGSTFYPKHLSTSGLERTVETTTQSGPHAGIIPPMNPPSFPPPRLIQEESAFRDSVTTMRSHSRLAVDTESNSLYAYRERVCLIQFSIPGADFLIDPLALRDLNPLDSLFSNPEIEKVFHGAEYDIMCLKRDFGFTFANLFDTQVASRTLGRKRSGLKDILAEELGIQMSKRYQRANWGKRPLSPDLLDYARLDTYYLLPLRDRLAEALQRAGRWQEACEACERLTNVDPHDNGFNPDGYWRISNIRTLTPRQVALLRELYLYRDSQARRFDRPPFKILGNETLLAIAQESPGDLMALRDLPGMTPGKIRRYGDGLLSAVARGRQAPIPRRPTSKRIAEATHVRYEVLHSWRKNVARKRRVESDVILPREVLWEIAQAAPSDTESLRRVMYPLEWRFQAYGEDILTILRD